MNLGNIHGRLYKLFRCMKAPVKLEFSNAAGALNLMASRRDGSLKEKNRTSRLKMNIIITFNLCKRPSIFCKHQKRI